MPTHDADDLYTALDTLDDRLLEIREQLAVLVMGIEQITIMLAADIRARNPDTYEQINLILEKRAEEWKKIDRERITHVR